MTENGSAVRRSLRISERWCIRCFGAARLLPAITASDHMHDGIGDTSTCTDFVISEAVNATGERGEKDSERFLRNVALDGFGESVKGLTQEFLEFLYNLIESYIKTKERRTEKVECMKRKILNYHS